MSFESITLGHDRKQVPQPSIVEGHPPSPNVDFIFSPFSCYPHPEVEEIRLPSPPPVTRKNLSSAPGSGHPLIEMGVLISLRHWNGALDAPGGMKIDAGNVRE